MLRAEQFFYLWNALNTLPEMQGRRVEACVIDGNSYAEVGRPLVLIYLCERRRNAGAVHLSSGQNQLYRYPGL